MKAGIWLNREYLQGGVIDKQVACSECDYTSGHVMSNWKYCPICGARMFITTEEMRAFMKEQEVSKGEWTMSDAERIETIEKCLNTLGVTTMNYEEFCRELEKKSFNDIKVIGWKWYCFISDVCEVLNE